MLAPTALSQARPPGLERLRRLAVSLLPAVVLLSAVVATLVALGGTAAVLAGFFALVLALERALPNDDAALSGAELSFRRLIRERRRAALRQRLRRRPLAEQRLLYLSEDQGWAALAERRHVGVQAIAVDSIVGTVERQKAAAFGHGFRPPRWSRDRWKGIWLAAQRGSALPPISVYRVGDRHYVRDGHHRVSVASALATAAIEAELVELRPSPLHQGDASDSRRLWRNGQREVAARVGATCHDQAGRAVKAVRSYENPILDGGSAEGHRASPRGAQDGS